MSNFGFHVDTYHLRLNVKMYLDKKGATAKPFKNNIHGVEWCMSFLKRHKDLTKRFACNIKKIHTATDMILCLSILE